MMHAVVEVDMDTVREMKEWRRQRETGREIAGADATVNKSQLPTPSEGVRDAEPEWMLSGVHVDADAEEEMERRMEEMEMERLIIEEEEEMARREEDEMARQEKLRIREELAQAQREEDEVDDEQAELDSEEFQEEVENLMRELRSEAQEHVLRAVEQDIHSLHASSLKSKELEEQAREAEEMYMRGIEEQQEYEQDEVEERQLALLLRRQEEEERLQQESMDALRVERQQERRRELKMEIQEEMHETEINGALMVSSPLEKYVREEEEELWEEANRSVEESPEKSHTVVWGGLRKMAEQKNAEMSLELKQRHDMFAERLREKMHSMHKEAEQLRRNIWKGGGVDFSPANHLINIANNIRDNFEEHIQMLDEEYRGIAERKDLWPPEQAKGLKHPLSAGAYRPKEEKPELDRSIPPFERPSTAPRRRKSAREKDRAIRDGRASAPTGYSFGIRAVFEALDPQRTGYISQESVEAAFPMLNLDIAKDELMAMCDGGRVDFVKLESMVLETIGDGTASRRESRINTPISRTAVGSPSHEDIRMRERVEHTGTPAKQKLMGGHQEALPHSPFLQAMIVGDGSPSPKTKAAQAKGKAVPFATPPDAMFDIKL